MAISGIDFKGGIVCRAERRDEGVEAQDSYGDFTEESNCVQRVETCNVVGKVEFGCLLEKAQISAFEFTPNTDFYKR